MPWTDELPALAALSNAEAAVIINAMTVTVLVPGTMVNSRTIPALFANPLDGERLNRKLDAMAARDVPTGDDNTSVLIGLAIRTCKHWMAPEQGGIDVGHAGVRGLLDMLPNIPDSGITTTEVATLKAAGEVVQAKYTPVDASAVGMARGTTPAVQVEVINNG